MGVPVTVDSDDLRVLITATGYAKQLDALLKQHKRDPFAPDEDAITPAHDRVAKLWRGAVRGETHPKWNEPPSEDAMELLRSINKYMHYDPREPKTFLTVGREWMVPGPNMPVGVMELRGKCLIEIGSLFEVVYWGDSGGRESTQIDKAQFCVRITNRGRNVLHISETPINAKLQ